MPRATASDWQYVITAGCISDTINLGSKQVAMSKSTVAILVVLLDLLLSFLLWFALLALNQFHKLADVDVDRGTLSAEDFTV